MKCAPFQITAVNIEIVCANGTAVYGAERRRGGRRLKRIEGPSTHYLVGGGTMTYSLLSAIAPNHRSVNFLENFIDNTAKLSPSALCRCMGALGAGRQRGDRG